ncbi:hypothetical protein JTB14_026195, partial [Gonioctena quinquepunctata]
VLGIPSDFQASLDMQYSRRKGPVPQILRHFFIKMQ